MRKTTGVKGLEAPRHDEKICAEVPQWLQVMYTTVYFNRCIVHANAKKNKVDGFCIDCLLSFCYNCLPNHAHHNHVKIRRYIYREVINRQDLCKFFNCSGIQSYLTNKDKVVFLKQRPQQEAPPPQNHQNQQHNLRFLHNCIICKRSLQTSVYCSIACKVSAIYRGEHNEESTQYRNEQINENDEGLENDINNGYKEDPTVSISPKRQKLRKGVALRAPMF